MLRDFGFGIAVFVVVIVSLVSILNDKGRKEHEDKCHVEKVEKNEHIEDSCLRDR